VIGKWVNKVLGRRAIAAPPQSPSTTAPALPVMAALVQATTLPPTIKAALLDPALALNPTTAPAAIENAGQILNIAAARFRGDKGAAIEATRDFVLARTPLDTARDELLEALASRSDENELITTPPAPVSAQANASGIYSRRKQHR